MYNQQVYFEATTSKAWNSEGFETIKEFAQKRLKENGWDDVRPALAVTVRAWIMKAALEGGLREQPQAGVEYYRQALDLVEWGRTIWKDVPKSSRGAIFEHSFLIGIRSLYLKMFMHAYTTDPGLNSKFPLEQLKEEAEDLLKETDIAPAGLAHAYVCPLPFLSAFPVP
jgi:stress-induced-phosphoprotein 1